MILTLRLAGLIVSTVAKRSTAWWIALGLLGMGLASSAAGSATHPLPVALSSVVLGFPSALILTWKGTRQFRELSRHLRTTPIGAGALFPAELVSALVTTVAPCALVAVSGLALLPETGAPEIAWQMWVIIPLLGVAAAGIASLLSRHPVPLLVLLAVTTAMAGFVEKLEPPVLRLLFPAVYTRGVWFWAGGDGSMLHPDIFLGASVILASVVLPLWLRSHRRRGDTAS